MLRAQVVGARDVVEALLAGIPGVIDVQHEDSGAGDAYLVTSAPGQDVRDPLAKAVVDVRVLDALSGQPISGVDIYYIPGNNLNAPQSPFAKTDLKGRGLGQLPSGKYLFTVNYRGFRPLTRNLLVRAGESYALVFKIYPSH
ncbi:hypothetical protein IID10_20565 [candidate division KSB1 bacterium]|nr:hypothetical protein [candidate division KSB1 bacterium]